MTELPPLDDLPRQDPLPSDDELAVAYASHPISVGASTAVLVVIGELALVVILLVLILFAQ